VGINLDTLQTLADKFKLSAIDFDVLKAHGLASKNDLVKILGRGEVKSKLEVKAHAFTATAQKAIEAVGGSAVKL
jgi:large subunit ribosomal protein L15